MHKGNSSTVSDTVKYNEGWYAQGNVHRLQCREGGRCVSNGVGTNQKRKTSIVAT